MNIFIGNLPKSLTEGELINLFADFGYVKSAKIIRKTPSNESKGYGFVDMPEIIEAKKAISNLNSKEIKGRKITVTPGHSLRFENRR